MRPFLRCYDDDMIFRHERDGVTWVDLEKPSREEIAAVAKEFAVNKRMETELYEPTPVPLSDADGENALLVLHFPFRDSDVDDEQRSQEIDFITGRKFIITVRYEAIAPLLTLHKELEAQEFLGFDGALTTDELLELIFEKLFEAVRDRTKHIVARLSHAEREMFSGQERKTIVAVSSISRELLHLESALADTEDPLMHFLHALLRRNFFGAHFDERLSRIISERDHVARLITSHREVATELRDTNANLLNAAQNEIMKTLTVITFIVLPLDTVINLFGFGFANMPFGSLLHEFWMIIAMMLVVAVFLTLFFRVRRWI